MPKETTKETGRTNVAIPAEEYARHAHIARLFGRPIQECTAEAVRQWNDTYAGKAAKRSRELLGKAA